ncbi:probable glutathione peroxidase 8 isoform X3 [Fukomys damarensis]|uniref:probable glutathione peroxidase 8 isoform X3 n=1 Tax=Fukomys damarensis TaxID=885580 RepID=UPI0008FEBD3D|nr:probable glutathione peroxidase 8 isoform X3 [Fukomys damarensis]
MEPLAAHPLKCSGPKAKVFAVLLSMVLCTMMLFLLQLKFVKPKINSFYTFEVKDAKGRTVSLEKFKGKFGESEPRSSKEIEAFARQNYGVTFPIFHKIKILGSQAEPAFKFLVDSSKREPRWNFWKYLVNPEGQVVKYWRPEEPVEAIKPDIVELIRQIIVKKKEDL